MCVLTLHSVHSDNDGVVVLCNKNKYMNIFMITMWSIYRKCVLRPTPDNPNDTRSAYSRH